jgi:NADH-quinone oxidoreductase subunit J
MTGLAVVFWVCGSLAVIGALGVVFSRKAVHSALWIALTMVNLAVLYVAQEAPFLGMVQIIVYTGAVMMLFLFVLMIVGVDASDSLVETIRGHRMLAIAAILVFSGLLVGGVGIGAGALARNADPVGLTTLHAGSEGNVVGIATLLFGRYVIAFELTAALLITAAIGAMILAHRERIGPVQTQEMRSRARFKDLRNSAPLPSPGVYSRHNAVDTPALLPDGTASDISVPEPLKARGTVRSGVDEAASTAEIVQEAAREDDTP